jgi:hypothetical protein
MGGAQGRYERERNISGKPISIWYYNCVCIFALIIHHANRIFPVAYYIAILSDLILLAAVRPGVDSASNRNEYQKTFLGVKAAGA